MASSRALWMIPGGVALLGMLPLVAPVLIVRERGVDVCERRLKSGVLCPQVAGRGPWRLTIIGDDIDLAAPAYIRGPYGFLTPMPFDDVPTPNESER